MQKLVSLLTLSLIAMLVVVVVGWAAWSPVGSDAHAVSPPIASDLPQAVAQLDAHFRSRWQAEGLTPSQRADDLKILRRASLALHGTLPSLEEIREFGADNAGDRLTRWTSRMLADSRFADYFAERLARSFVGTEQGQFIVFRRDRFVDWLSEQLRGNRPYDEMVRELIGQHGLWTGEPATNFVTAAVVDGDVDENKLAGRSVRAFLGQRIDCAQCHDHPFDDWKQPDFEGLASFFGQTRISLVGVEDKPARDGEPVEYQVEDRETLETRLVTPRVPFHDDWLPSEGTRRERLARWITHRDNRRFERAIANRVWGYLFGRPYIEPVDDMPDPGDWDADDLLDILGRDFRNHGCDLRRLILVITSSQPFRLSSTHSVDASDGYADNTGTDLEQAELHWATFPLTRLRPEQVIGSMLQAASIKTIDRNSHLLVRVVRLLREREFVEEYGDAGENELQLGSGTIPQALLRMNGKLANEIGEASPLTACGRIAAFAGSDECCLETCYLVCLSRRPTVAEQDHFLPLLADAANGTRGERAKVVEDIFWTLFNSPEFSWSH